jgi:prepilin-type N-terminal cleavage/methylation domain-containing protein
VLGSVRGFTLIEVLSVVAIIALLMGFVVTMSAGAKQRAGMARAKSELSALTQALENYRRYYGDYPQTGAAGQATPAVTSTIGINQVQSLLFNALTGVYAPNNFSTRLNGPSFIDLSKFTLEVSININTFGVPNGSPPVKQAVANSFLDPWGRRYVYYYKPASARPVVAGAWRAPAYVLYSVGPDGLQSATPNVGTGLYSSGTQNSGTNADNIYADNLQ